MNSINCASDPDEAGSDEPYVLATVADLTRTPAQVTVTKYGPCDDVDEGVTHDAVPVALGTPKSMTDGFNNVVVVGQPFGRPDELRAGHIRHPSDVVIAISMIENGDETDVKRALASRAAVASQPASIGMTRSDRVQKRLEDVGGSTGIPAPSGRKIDGPIGTVGLASVRRSPCS